jgi:hypothetical protein
VLIAATSIVNKIICFSAEKLLYEVPKRDFIKGADGG